MHTIRNLTNNFWNNILGDSMVLVLEFRSVEEINKYLQGKKLPQFDITPVQRMFENPNTKLLTSCMSYVLVIND